MMLQFSLVLWLPYFVTEIVATLHGQREARSPESHDQEWLDASTNKRVQARSVKSKNSMQILYEENVTSYAHHWGVYFGPRGIPVDPCNPEPFSKVFNLTGEALPENRFSDINTPPLTPSGTWSGFTSPLEEADCSIVGSGSGLPTLICGQSLTVAFAKDPGYADATIDCNERNVFHHRAYFVEFTL
ncbi:hypothetical protein AALT_g11079 [Alternaria alternata]|nr:hypothetical protein AALT_g11079 [Alternaria alternata]